MAWTMLTKPHEWVKMAVRPHFILWGRIANNPSTIAEVAITERHRLENGIVVTVWEDTVSAEIAGNLQSTSMPLIHLIDKFERLWPCTFLAKEYRGTPHFRKYTDDLQND